MCATLLSLYVRVVHLVLVVGILSCLCRSALAAQSDTWTNFIVIMADDLGYGDLSCFGDRPYRTEHLDLLAEEGIKLTDFHSNGAVCSPTRAALMTGRYQQRAGLDKVIYADPGENRHYGLQPSEWTVAEALAELGYATGMMGKWHLGYEPEYNPVTQGFDEFHGYVSGNVCYQSHLDRMGVADWWHNASLSPEEGYSTHLITDHAVDFIKQNRGRPFFLYVAHECVHSPYQGPNDPPIRQLGQRGEIRNAKVKDVDRAYGEMIVEMDRGVGKIIQALNDNELSKQTLVLFFSDNGATPQGSNGILNGHKGTVWEGGHRVPMIAWMPGRIPPGAVSNTPAVTMDIMPTLIELAGGNTPDNLDGCSLVPVLFKNQPLPNRELHWSYNSHWAIRDGDWKLVNEGGKNATLQLFNLKDDPSESNDISARHVDVVNRLAERHQLWEADVLTGATPQPTK